MSTDRTQYKQAETGSLTGSRTVGNAAQVIAQVNQRFDGTSVGNTATTAGTTYTFPIVRLDRPVVIKEVRILPTGAVAQNAANFVTIAYGYTNDAGGALTTMGSMNTGTGAGGAALVSGTSFLIPATAGVNPQVPAGSQFQVTVTPSGTGVALPAGTAFQVLFEEV